MEKIALPFGKVLKGVVIGPIKVSKEYAKSKLLINKYQKQYNVTPLNKMKKKVFKSNEYFVDMTQEISNPLIKLFKSHSANTTDVYFDKEGKPVISCSYSVTQNLINKNTTLICNCISAGSIEHASYYYIACCMKYNVVTDQTSDLLTSLQSKIR